MSLEQLRHHRNTDHVAVIRRRLYQGLLLTVCAGHLRAAAPSQATFPVDEYRAAVASVQAAEARHAKDRVIIFGSIVERGADSILVKGKTVCTDTSSLGCLSPLADYPLLVTHPNPGDVLGINTFLKGTYYFVGTRIYNSVTIYVYDTPQDIADARARLSALGQRAAQLGVDPSSGESLEAIEARRAERERLAREKKLAEEREAEERWQAQDSAFEKQRSALQRGATRTSYEAIQSVVDFPEGCTVGLWRPGVGGMGSHISTEGFLVRKDLPPALFSTLSRRSALREDFCSFLKAQRHDALVTHRWTVWYYPCLSEQHCLLAVESELLPPAVTPSVAGGLVANPFHPAASSSAGTTSASTSGQPRVPLSPESNEVWTDTSSQLMWSRHDSGKDVDFEKAVQLCRDSRSGGFSDWRLPKLAEVNRVMEQYPEVREGQRTAPIRLSPDRFLWLAEPSRQPGMAVIYNLQQGRGSSLNAKAEIGARGLCVRTQN